MMNKTVFIFFVCLFVSCDSQYKHVSDRFLFNSYHDKMQKKLSAKGDLDLFNYAENGLWKYYNEDGELIKVGNYDTGFQTGTWEYHFPKFDTTMTWQIMNNIRGRFKFSLPVSFIESKIEGSTQNDFTAIEKFNKEVFSIADLGIATKEDLESYFDRLVDREKKEFYIIEGYSSIVKTDEGISYTFDKLYERHKQKGAELVVQKAYNIYDNHLVVLSYVCAPADTIKGKMLLEDIFFHTAYNGIRIADPFVDIRDLSKKENKDKRKN